MSNLINNTARLQGILDVVNNLPEVDNNPMGSFNLINSLGEDVIINGIIATAGESTVIPWDFNNGNEGFILVMAPYTKTDKEEVVVPNACAILVCDDATSFFPVKPSLCSIGSLIGAEDIASMYTWICGVVLPTTGSLQTELVAHFYDGAIVELKWEPIST
jgi:hypothetical protein